MTRSRTFSLGTNNGKNSVNGKKQYMFLIISSNVHALVLFKHLLGAYYLVTSRLLMFLLSGAYLS